MNYYVILQKAKPYTRTRRGRFEQVKGYPGKPSELKELKGYEIGKLVFRDIEKYSKKEKGRFQILKVVSEPEEIELDNGKKAVAVRTRLIYDSKLGNQSVDEDFQGKLEPSHAYHHAMNIEIVPYDPKKHPKVSEEQLKDKGAGIKKEEKKESEAVIDYRQAVEWEKRLFRGEHDEDARKAYNKLRAKYGLQEVTDWSEIPRYTIGIREDLK